MIKVWGLWVLAAVALFAQDSAMAIAQECIEDLEKREALVEEQKILIEKLQTARSLCEDEIVSLKTSLTSLEGAFGECRDNLERKDLIIERYQELNATLQEDRNKCYALLGEAQEQYERCADGGGVEPSVFEKAWDWAGPLAGFILGALLL